MLRGHLFLKCGILYHIPLLPATQKLRLNRETFPGKQKFLLHSIRACIRFSDGLAWFRNERAFVIVLPQCDERGAAIVLKKIESNLEMLELRDARNQAVYELAWSIHACDGTLKGDAVFARLFADMRREARA